MTDTDQPAEHPAAPAAPDASAKPAPAPDAAADTPAPAASTDSRDTAEEFGGRGGPDPTRFGDWEKNGRCVDF